MEPATAVYVRVSTRRQDARSQEPDLKRAAAAAAGPVVWYRDKFTGTEMSRPGFNRLMDDARAGKVSRVIVWKLDRFGRSVRGVLEFLDELKGLKVTLYSVTDGLDTANDTPLNRAVFSIMATFAQLETEIRGERITAGQAAARAAGKTWGGGVKGKRLKVNPEQEALIRRLKAEGEKVSAIARMTALSRPTVYSVLGASD